MRLWRRRDVGGALAGAVVLAATGARAAAVTHRVTIRRFRFEPATLQVRPGDRVQWINRDLAPHTATALSGTWETGALGHGATGEVLFEAPGRQSYACAFHPHMKGEVTVGAAG